MVKNEWKWRKLRLFSNEKGSVVDEFPLVERERGISFRYTIYILNYLQKDTKYTSLSTRYLNSERCEQLGQITLIQSFVLNKLSQSLNLQYISLSYINSKDLLFVYFPL